jgi:soluble lytic murein transglycosylase-like protein
VSVAGVAELRAIASPGAAGGVDPIIGAAQRVRQLQALIAQVEDRAPHASFSEALGAAQTSSSMQPDIAAQTTASSQQLDIAMPTTAIPETTPIAAYAAVAASGAAASGATGSGAIASTPVEGAAYVPMIEQAAARYGLDPSLLYGLIEQESGFDPSASSSAGALGLTQLMPSTAVSLGVTEPLDPAQSIEGGARYLSQLLRQFAGDTADALAAYNAGPGAVEQYGGVPPFPETQQYVAKVLGYAASHSQGAQDTGAAAPSVAAAIAAPTATTSGAIA